MSYFFFIACLKYVKSEVYLNFTISFVFSHYDSGLRLFIQPGHRRRDARLLVAGFSQR
jgi:hypothetical protein